MPQLHRELPELAQSRPVVFAGHSVITDSAAKTRMVDQTVWPVPAGEASRAYLRAALDVSHAPRGWVAAHSVPYRRETCVLLDVPQPYHWAGLTRRRAAGRWAMVDLSSAYWTVLRSGTLDMRVVVDSGRVHVGYGLLELPAVDQIREKTWQRATVGSLRMRTMQLLRYGRPDVALGRNPALAPDAVALVMLTMHAVARDMIERFGAQLVMVDCYAVPEDRGLEAVAWLAEHWGLKSRVKSHGMGVLYGVGRYRVGDRETLTVKSGDRRMSPASSNLWPVPTRARNDLRAARLWLLARTVDRPPLILPDDGDEAWPRGAPKPHRTAYKLTKRSIPR